MGIVYNQLSTALGTEHHALKQFCIATQGCILNFVGVSAVVTRHCSIWRKISLLLTVKINVHLWKIENIKTCITFSILQWYSWKNVKWDSELKSYSFLIAVLICNHYILSSKFQWHIHRRRRGSVMLWHRPLASLNRILSNTVYSFIPCTIK